MTIIVDGFTSTNKVPGYYARNINPAGKASGGKFRKLVLLIGIIVSPGNLVVDSEARQVFSEDDVDVAAGAGSELAMMGYQALKEEGASVYLATPTPGGSSIAATLTVTVTGTWTTTGMWMLRLAGHTFSGPTSTSDTVTTVAAAMKLAINSMQRFPFTADNTAGVLTVTERTAGVRGKQNYGISIPTYLATGMVVTVTGGTAVPSGAVPFATGAVSEDLTILLAALATAQYDRIVVAANDATNLALVKTHVNAQAGATVGNLEQVIFATNGTLAAAKTLSNTTINNTRFQQIHNLYGERHPSIVAASHAAKRAVTEEDNPSPRYGGTIIKGAVAATSRVDLPTNAQADDALNNGVTPTTTTSDGDVVVIRGVTTYCRNAGVQDDRCLDINQATMPDYARARFRQMWEQDQSPNFPHVSDNPPDEGPEPPAGTLYPRLYQAMLQNEMKLWESRGWVIDVDLAPAIVEYNEDTRRLMFEAPVIAAALNYQVGGNIRGQARA